MVNLQKSGDRAVKFVFTDSDHYLYGNGEIEVPVNSLLLVIDESEMVTFKKLSGDPFLSFRADNSNLGTKEAIEQFYKENMVGSTGGGGSESGITSGEVQTMIDESISGKADTSAVTAAIDAAVSGKVDTSAITTSITSGSTDSEIPTAKAVYDATQSGGGGMDDDTQQLISTALNDLNDRKADLTELSKYQRKGDYVATSTLADYMTNDAFDEYATAKERIISGALNDLDNRMTAVESGGSVTVDTTLDSGSTNPVANSAITTAIDAKQDALSAGTGIEISGNVISATGGGGATYSAGTNIDITNDTINCTLPITSKDNLYSPKVMIGYHDQQYIDYYVKADYGVSIGFTNYINGQRSVCLGGDNQANGYCSVAANGVNTAQTNYSFACGNRSKTSNDYEFGCGRFNNSVSSSSTFGDSGNTIFSVGNGTADNARHNAFEIRQNGDIYVNDGTNDVRLQDTILALGGLKLVKLTQAEYDALATKDSSTLYIISD